jgi:hypothetical protein
LDLHAILFSQQLYFRVCYEPSADIMAILAAKKGHFFKKSSAAIAKSGPWAGKSRGFIQRSA